MSGSEALARWDAPNPLEVGETVEEFLKILHRPTVLWLPGQDPTRTRAISTLLHGNESSGVRAIHRWIREKHRSSVNLLCFIGNVKAALTEPLFSYRSVPGGQDWNRCFFPPYEKPESKVAEAFLDLLHEVRPESLIDLHNTSGRSPTYGVTTVNGPDQEALTGYFSEQLIVTDLRLGTLMEATEKAWPTVTIEAGGCQDPLAHETAFRGLMQYAQTKTFQTSTNRVHVTHHPIRVELQKGATLAYNDRAVDDTDLTLPVDVDQYNFKIVSSQDILGWVGNKGLEVLLAKNALGQNLHEEIFSLREGELRVKQSSRLMMATTRWDIAQSDCLFYILPVS